MKNSNRTRVLPACSAVRHTTATPRAPTASLKGIYIYMYIYIFMYFFLWRCDPTLTMASSFLGFLDHTQRRTTVGRTPLDA